MPGHAGSSKPSLISESMSVETLPQNQGKMAPVEEHPRSTSSLYLHVDINDTNIHACTQIHLQRDTERKERRFLNN